MRNERYRIERFRHHFFELREMEIMEIGRIFNLIGPRQISKLQLGKNLVEVGVIYKIYQL